MQNTHAQSRPTLLERGKPYPGLVPFEGIRFEMHSGIPTIFRGSRSPTLREVMGARTGRIDVALAPCGKHSLFLLFKQPELLKGWADMPFSWCKVAKGSRILASSAVPPGATPKGYLLTLILTDQHGVIHALRGVSVSPRFSAAFDGLCREQERHEAEFSVAAHDAEVDAAYRRWPRAEGILSRAVAVEQAGVSFPSS